MNKRIFGELELVILQIFRNDSSVFTVRDILEKLGGNDKYTTIMTVMNRLVDKGELAREKKGFSYSYYLQEKKASFSLLEKWKQKIFGGNSALMISYLLESSKDITEEELTKIQKMIDQTKQKGKLL